MAGAGAGRADTEACHKLIKVRGRRSKRRREPNADVASCSVDRRSQLPTLCLLPASCTLDCAPLGQPQSVLQLDLRLNHPGETLSAASPPRPESSSAALHRHLRRPVTIHDIHASPQGIRVHCTYSDEAGGALGMIVGVGDSVSRREMGGTGLTLGMQGVILRHRRKFTRTTVAIMVVRRAR